MRWVDAVGMRARMLLGRKTAAAQLDEELRFHLENQIAENMAAGMSAEEARFAALRSFGNLAALRDETRTTWNWNGAEQFLRDLRYGIRTLGRTPAFTAMAVLVMALGIGANVALFTLVWSVLLKPLPFRDPDRLISLYENTSDQFRYNAISGGVFEEWQKENRSFSDLAMLSEDNYILTSTNGELPEKLLGASCTWNMLSVLGVRPALGHDFSAGDDRREAEGKVLLTWSLWKRRFGGDKGILSRTVHLNGRPYTVIGILPAWFFYDDPQIQLWTSIYHDKPPQFLKELGSHNFGGFGRLRPGVSESEARADLSVTLQRLRALHPDNAFISRAANTKPLLEGMVGDLKRPLYVLLAATGCVLLIACLNVANLLVARAAARQKDMAIRTALGGGRLRLLRERLLESLLLSAAGGLMGLLLAWTALQWLAHTRQTMSRIDSIHIDGVVALFTAGVVILCTLIAGAASSLHFQRRNLMASLQDAGRGSSAGRSQTRLRMGLLTAEVGLTVVLLVGAGLLLKSYQRLRSSELGCTTENVLTMQLDLFGWRYREPAQLANFYRTLLERIRAIPGVEGAGFGRAVPGQGYWGDNSFTVVEHPPLPQGVMQYAINREVDPGFFAAMGIPILRGQTFDPDRMLDKANQAVISESFAKQYFPNEEPIGKHLKYGQKNYEICGIAGDTRYSQAEAPKPIQYYSLYTGEQNNGTLVIRSAHDVEKLALPVQRVIRELDRDLPVSDVLTMNQMLGKSAMDQSFNATLLTGFAGLSLLLAAVGLFGVLSYIAAQRTGEIGIRLALGAQRGQVLGRTLADGLRPALIGLALGIAVSLEVSKLMRDMLYDTRPVDPAVLGAVALTLLLVAALACAVPAWRASRVDPARALRTE